MKVRRLAAFLLALILLGGCASRPPEHQLVQIEGDTLRIPLLTVADGMVHFFTFMHGATRVNFLVRTDGHGTLHVHLDACYSCYRYKRGFVVEGPQLVCIACRLGYRLEDELWDYIGACAPISIHSSLDGDDLVIERSLLEKAARYF